MNKYKVRIEWTEPTMDCPLVACHKYMEIDGTDEEDVKESAAFTGQIHSLDNFSIKTIELIQSDIDKLKPIIAEDGSKYYKGIGAIFESGYGDYMIIAKNEFAIKQALGIDSLKSDLIKNVIVTKDLTSEHTNKKD